SFTSMRSQPKSLRALTLFSSSIKPAGMAPRPSRFQTTSRSCSSRHAHPNSTAKKISGNSCGRTGCRTEFSNPSTISSITAATLATRSSISRGKSCPSPAAIGQPQVTQSEDWYERSHRTGFNARLRDELLAGEVFRSMASEMLLRSQRKLHHAFQELVRRQADEVVHDELLGVQADEVAQLQRLAARGIDEIPVPVVDHDDVALGI